MITPLAFQSPFTFPYKSTAFQQVGFPRPATVPTKPLTALRGDVIHFGFAQNLKPLPRFERFDLLPDNSNPFAQVFNPGIAQADNGTHHFLSRRHITLDDSNQNKAIWKYYSQLDYATIGPDGKSISHHNIRLPIPSLTRYPHGSEDARITKIGDTYYIVFNASNRRKIRGSLLHSKSAQHSQELKQSRPTRSKAVYNLSTKERDALLEKQLQLEGALIYLIRTQDFKDFTRIGNIGPKLNGKNIYDKNAFFHPEKVIRDGRSCFLLYHRIFPDIQYVFAPSLKDLQSAQFWEEQLQPEILKKNTLLQPRFSWESSAIGGGSPPLKTKEGWLMLYQASKNLPGRSEKGYSVGAVLLDTDNPTKVLSRSPNPILEPEGDGSKDGNIIFPSGSTIIKGKEDEQDQLFIYYGANDTRCRIASCNLDGLLGYLKQYDRFGRVKKKEASAT